MKNLDDFQIEIAEKIFSELVGQTINSAKDILKAVTAMLNERAVIRGDDNE